MLHRTWFSRNEGMYFLEKLSINYSNNRVAKLCRTSLMSSWISEIEKIFPLSLPDGGCKTLIVDGTLVQATSKYCVIFRRYLQSPFNDNCFGILYSYYYEGGLTDCKVILSAMEMFDVDFPQVFHNSLFSLSCD